MVVAVCGRVAECCFEERFYLLFWRGDEGNIGAQKRIRAVPAERYSGKSKIKNKMNNKVVK